MSNWTEIDDTSGWEPFIEAAARGEMTLEEKCPNCGSSSLRVFFLRGRSSERGGMWIWCGHCKKYFHCSSKAPAWWENITNVPSDALVPKPIKVELLWEQIKPIILRHLSVWRGEKGQASNIDNR
jgi:hypothetical protein